MNPDPERAKEGLDHLQVAALELVSAARAFLDVAEGLIREPGAAATVVKTAASMAATAASMATDRVRPQGARPSGPTDPDDDGEGAVRHITVT